MVSGGFKLVEKDMLHALKFKIQDFGILESVLQAIPEFRFPNDDYL